MDDLINLEALKSQWINEQSILSKKLHLEDTFNYSDIALIAGVDIAYFKANNKEYGVCCIVIYDKNKKMIIEKQHYYNEINIPYVPGFLSYREIPLILPTIKLLKNKPDLFMCDGNGYLHPRHMGLASYLSFFVNQPTMGVSKSYHKINDVNFNMPENVAGAYEDIIIDNIVYGRAVRSHFDVKPIFVSSGNNISLKTATELAIELVNKDSRLPVPVRYADLQTHIEREALVKKFDKAII